MLHRHCKINGVPNIKVAIFYMVNIVEHELQFACKILHVCLEIHCDLSTAKSDEIFRGVCSNVNIGDLQNLISNCL